MGNFWKTKLEQGNKKRTIGKTIVSIGVVAVGLAVYVLSGGKIKIPGSGVGA